MAKARSSARFSAGFRARPRARWLALASLGISALAVMAACVSSQTPVDTELAGQWQLDPAVSDSVEPRVAQVIDQAQARQRRQRRGGAFGSGRSRGSGPGGAGAEDADQAGADLGMATPLLGPDFDQLRTHLLQILGAPPSLSLAVQPDGVTIKSDDLPGRNYVPAEPFVRFDEYGNATVSSGWSGHAFVVRERYMSHASLTERYEIDPKSGTLIYTRQLKDPTLGNIQLKSIYHHA